MDKKMLANRIVELSEQVKYHADLYFNGSQPEITDLEYDDMVGELKICVSELEKLDPQAPELAIGTEALNDVGSMPSYGRKVQHSNVMGSLSKVTSVKEVKEWFEKYGKPGMKIAVTPKADGCFRHDSKVMMANGEERPISEIKEGMSVLSFNELTGKTEPKKVVSILVRKTQKPEAKVIGWMILNFTGDREIVCTVDHPFLTSNRGWIPAKDLTEGDQFVEPEF